MNEIGPAQITISALDRKDLLVDYSLTFNETESIRMALKLEGMVGHDQTLNELQWELMKLAVKRLKTVELRLEKLVMEHRLKN